MALILLKGVLEDGANRGLRVPANPRHTLRITQTEDVTIRLTATDAAGVLLDLNAIAAMVILTVKLQPPDMPPIVSRLGVVRSDLGLGVVDFTLVAQDTVLVPPGRYIYDVWLLGVTGTRDPLVPLSPFLLEPTAGLPNSPVTVPPPVPVSVLTADSHAALHQLIHFINTGPGKGFLSGAYREILPLAGLFPTSITWWQSAAKAAKIVEKLLVRNPNQTPSSITWNMYDTLGLTVIESTTDLISYSGVIETSRVRAIS